MRIPTLEEHPSMNLGQAVAVCLHELVWEMNVSVKAEKQPAATAAEVNRLTAILPDALHASGSQCSHHIYASISENGFGNATNLKFGLDHPWWQKGEPLSRFPIFSRFSEIFADCDLNKCAQMSFNIEYLKGREAASKEFTKSREPGLPLDKRLG
jgi:hypothetical protein